MFNKNKDLEMSMADVILSYQDYQELKSRLTDGENTIKQLKGQNQSLLNECTKFSDENSSLKQQVKDISMSSLRLNKEHIKLQDKIHKDNKAKDGEIASLLNDRQSHSLCQGELQKIREELNTKQAILQQLVSERQELILKEIHFSEKTAKLLQENEQISRERAKYEKEFLAVRALMVEQKLMQDGRYFQLQREKDSLTRELDEIRSESEEKAKKTAKTLNEQSNYCNKLEQQLKQLHGKYAELSDQKRSLHLTQNNFESKLRQTEQQLRNYERVVSGVFKSESINISVGSLASSQNQISKTERRSPEQLMEIMQRFSSIQSAKHSELLAHFERLKRENTELTSNIDGLRRVIHLKNEDIDLKQKKITELTESLGRDESIIEQLNRDKTSLQSELSLMRSTQSMINSSNSSDFIDQSQSIIEEKNKLLQTYQKKENKWSEQKNKLHMGKAKYKSDFEQSQKERWQLTESLKKQNEEKQKIAEQLNRLKIEKQNLIAKLSQH